MPLTQEEILTFIFNQQRFEGINRRVLSKPPKWLFPGPPMREYQRELVKFVKLLESSIEEILIPELPLLTAEVELTSPIVIDTWADDVELILNRLEFRFQENLGTVTGLASEISFKVNAWNERQWQKTVRQVLGVNLFLSEPWLEAELTSWANANATLIKSIPDQMLTDVSGITQRGLQNGLRHEQIATEIRARYKVTENRAKLIARDQVSKLNGQLTKLRQESIGIRSYIWQTAMDERVRETHRANNLQEFKWDDPPGTGHPGEDIQCRCIAEPVFSEKFLNKSKAA